MISPHGGVLVQQFIETCNNALKTLVIDQETIFDVKNIARGVYSPLTGFMREGEFKSVVDTMRLPNGLVWSMPITLDITQEQKDLFDGESAIVLIDEKGNQIAELRNIEIYTYDPAHWALNVFGTTDKDHPGVNYVFEGNPWLVGGDIRLLDNTKSANDQYELTPNETRAHFEQKGRNSVVAFQTRNPPHRGHEYIQRCALESVDGLFVNPVVGKKKAGDFKDEYILGAYEILIDTYYSRARATLGVLPVKMRYAGPKEAIFHAIVRQNFGCSHFIVGRDHAGVGDFYGTYDAQKIFDTIEPNELGIQIMRFENASYCDVCEQVVSDKTRPEGSESKFHISGTNFRKKLVAGESVSDKFMRTEVYEFLKNGTDQFHS